MKLLSVSTSQQSIDSERASDTMLRSETGTFGRLSVQECSKKEREGKREMKIGRKQKQKRDNEAKQR